MENHNTHLVSEQSKEEHGYKYDNFGNVLIDSIDDLIYDKFVDVKRKPQKDYDTKKFIKNIINKEEFPSESGKKKDINESDPNSPEEKNNKKKRSLINIKLVDDNISENEEESEDSDKNKINNKNKNNMNQNKKSNINNNIKINQQNEDDNNNESEEESEENNSDSEIAKQNLIKNRISGYIKPPVNINQNQKQKHYLNYSDDPVFNIKKPKDLKKMYNQKCFISSAQVEVQLNSITEIKGEEDMSDQMKKINSYNYLGEKDKNYAGRLNDSKEDKTNDKFLDSLNIKENMIKNDFREARRVSNKEEERQILNNVSKKKNHLTKKKKNNKNNNSSNINKGKMLRKNLVNNNLSEEDDINNNKKGNYNNGSNNDIKKNDELKGNNIFNNNNTKTMILSKYNMDDAKNNVNLGDESKNVFDSKTKKTDSDNNIINSNNIDETTLNEKKQRGNTQININENNLDKSDNKIFKEDQTFKSIKVYMKKPKEVRSSGNDKENEFDEFELLNEDIFNNLNMVSDRKKADLKGEDIFNQNKADNEINNINKLNSKDEIAKIDEDNKNTISGIEKNEASLKTIESKVNKNLSPINNSSLIKEEENQNDNILNNKKDSIRNKNPNNMINKDNNTVISLKDNKTNINNDVINDKETNNIQNENNPDKKLLIKKISLKGHSLDNSSKEDEIIFTKPILIAEYIFKIRKDTRMNIRPEKLPRVFISKTYTSFEKQNNILNLDEPILIPKINICYLIKSPKLILMDSKKDFLKMVINDYCFITKLLGNNLNTIPKIDSNMEGEPKLEDLANKNKKKKKKKIKKKKHSDESYVSVSLDNKNIFPNHIFKEDFPAKNELVKKKKQKSTGSKLRHNQISTHINNKNNINNKKQVPKLLFEKIKKHKIKNSMDTSSSAENISEDKNKIKKNKDNKEENSTRIRVHKRDKKDNSNIKIKIKNPRNSNLEYQQIEIKPGVKGNNYKLIKKSKINKFRANKNIIKAKNKIFNNNINNLDTIKLKSNLKPVIFANNQKQIFFQGQNQPKNIQIKDNKSFCVNSKTYDNQINIIFSNKETHHMVGYDRHFGKEEQCPLCKTMKKKTQFMEDKIFGQNKIVNSKPLTANPAQYSNELNYRFKNKIVGINKKEEEKNFNNNIFRELNIKHVGQNKNKIKQNNIFRDVQRKYSAKKSMAVKNMFKIVNEPYKGNNNKNILGNLSDVEFPAINSYFHS